MQNANTVKFTGGLTLDDLEISMTQGYDKSDIDHIPSDSEFIIIPRLNGDTWNISIKGTNDVLTIKNQSGIYSAISEFQFDSKTYTVGEVIEHFGLNVPHFDKAGTVTTLPIRLTGMVLTRGDTTALFTDRLITILQTFQT